MDDAPVAKLQHRESSWTPQRLIDSCGVAALIAMHVAATAWVHWQCGWLLTIPFASVWHFVAMFGLPAAQCVLCGFWMALGPPPALWRFVLTGTLLVLALHVALRSLRAETMLLIGGFLFAHWLIARVVLGVCRSRFGWRIQRRASDASGGKLQLRHFFAGTALWAFMFSVFRRLPPEWGVYRFIFVGIDEVFQFGRLAMFDLVLAATVMTSVAQRRWRMRQFAFATLAAVGLTAAAIALGTLIGDRWLMRRFPVHAVTIFLVLQFSLLWLRLAGYRLATKKTRVPP